MDTLTPVARLVSPALDKAYGDSFGAQGQVYVTPDERCVRTGGKGRFSNLLTSAKQTY